MIESVLYAITRYVKPFLVVSIIVLLIGSILDYLTKKFDIHKKSTRFLGLLSRNGKKTKYTTMHSIYKTDISYILCI